jgi:predicted transcriptional regulator
MKTVTVKADEDFDALLTALAGRLNTTKSRVIRDAVRNYLQYIDREALKKQMRAASLKTRRAAIEEVENLSAADSDGL